MASKKARAAVELARRESGQHNPGRGKPKKPKQQAAQQRKLTDGPRGGYRLSYAANAAAAGTGEQPLAVFESMLPKGTSGQPKRECPRAANPSPLPSRASER